MRARLFGIALLAAALPAACNEGTPPSVEPADPGPPSVVESALEEHAGRLDDDELRRRPAGSRPESLAGTYLLGHLHGSGYATVLDPVPVADLVRSTNIVAVPPSGGVAAAVVTVAYDTPPQGALTGGALAVFLEVARALRVSDPRHEVSFVALGAVHADGTEGRLGSRRLARDLLDREISPFVITIGEVEKGAPVSAAGDGARAFLGLAGRETSIGAPGPLAHDDVFARAGFDHMIVSGDPAVLARTLLAYLQG
jgi:hypothetical protein